MVSPECTIKQAASIGIAVLMMFIAAGCATKSVVKDEPEPVKEEPKEEVKAEPLSFEKVYFDYNRSRIRVAGRDSLKRAVDQLLAQPDVKLSIDGHCDERGSDEYNIDLGWKRAYAVRDYLKRLGVDESRMYPTSYGRARPAVIGSDETTWSKNRRVEISERR